MQKNIITGVAVAAALAVTGLFFIYGPSFITDGAGLAASPATAEEQTLVVQDEVVGSGAEATPGTVATIHYTGRLQDGTVFDTSLGRTPLPIPLGQGVVIPGMEQGLIGMKEGGKRLIIIPPHLGYGDIANGPIPANSTLIFEVELVKVGDSQ